MIMDNSEYLIEDMARQGSNGVKLELNDRLVNTTFFLSLFISLFVLCCCLVIIDFKFCLVRQHGLTG